MSNLIILKNEAGQCVSRLEPQNKQETSSAPQFSFMRLAGFSFGIGTQAMFAVTVVGLFSFLRFGHAPGNASWVLVDALLALQFAIPHSLLLHPKTSARLRSVISAEMYGAFFCICTCVSLLLIFRYWRSTNSVIWDLDGIGATCMTGAFCCSWIWMLYSICLTGLGYQTGWTQWQYWYSGENIPRRNFESRSLYRFMRHLVYLGFLGLIWFTPTMTIDHVLLTGIWTVYIGIGSVLKDQRLLFYLGDSYRLYTEKVAGYPLMAARPLAKQNPPMEAVGQASSLSCAARQRIADAPFLDIPQMNSRELRY